MGPKCLPSSWKTGKQKRRKSLNLFPLGLGWIEIFFFFFSKIRNWLGDVIWVWKNSLRQALPANGPHLACPELTNLFVWFHQLAYIVACKFATFGFEFPFGGFFPLSSLGILHGMLLYDTASVYFFLHRICHWKEYFDLVGPWFIDPTGWYCGSYL